MSKFAPLSDQHTCCFLTIRALLMAWMPPPDGIAWANVMSVEAITEGEDIHVGSYHHRH
jgi:hypothetical protein